MVILEVKIIGPPVRLTIHLCLDQEIMCKQKIQYVIRLALPCMPILSGSLQGDKTLHFVLIAGEPLKEPVVQHGEC